MKIIYMIISVLILSIAISSETYADCPVGYDEVIVTMQAYGCDWDVKFCVKCGVGPVPATVSIVEAIPHPGCQVALPLEDVIEELGNEGMTWQFIQANLCSGLNIPPCGNGSETVVYETWICWKAVKIEYFGDVTIKYEACDYDAKCTQTFEFCMENGVIKRTLISAVPSGTPSCFKQGWQVAIPDLEDPEVPIGEESDCFIINTACTP